jgi:hypothetical protein
MILLVGILFVPTGVTAHAPTQVCSVCHTLESADTVEVVESELRVEVDGESGSTWTSRVRVSDATATRLSESQSRVDALVADSFDAGYPTAVDEPQNLTYTFADQTLTVRYRVPETVGTGRLGVVFFTGFESTTHADVNADKLTVRGPPDRAVTHPQGGTAEGNQVVWRDKRNANIGGVVAFAGRDGPLAKIQTTLAVRAYELDKLAPELIQFGTVPAVLLGLLSVGLVTAESRRRASKRLWPDDATTTAVLKGLVAGGLGYAALSGLLAALSRLLASLGLVDGSQPVAMGNTLVMVGLLLVIPAITTATTLIALDRLPALLDQTDMLAGLSGNESRLAGGAVAVWTVLLLIGGPVSIILVFVCSPLVFLPFGVLAGVDHWARWLLPPVAVGTAVTAAIPATAQVGLIFVTPMMLALAIAGWGLLGTTLFIFGTEQTGRQSATQA